MMPPARRLGWLAWLAPAGLLVAAAAIVMAAPAERTLGDAIRYVYVHVALTWAGLQGLAAAAGLGMLVLVRGGWRLALWMRTTGVVGLALFTLGTIISVAAAQATWGGGFLTEPRSQTALRLLALGVLVFAPRLWRPRPRVQAGLAIGYALLTALALGVTPLLLHPRSPINTSTSPGIRAAFASLAIIFTLLGGWAVIMVRRHDDRRARKEAANASERQASGGAGGGRL